MSEINKIMTVPIKGMHCRSCEILIEDSLNEIKGVDKVKLDYRKGQAEINYSEEKPSLEKISEAIIEAGYAIGTDESKKYFFSHHKADYKDLGVAAVLLLAIYLILKGLGLNAINFNTSSDNLTVGVVLLVGLTAGFSTCMALVGGLVLGISSRHAEKHPEATPAQKMRPHIFFNIGRILTFALLGGLLGVVGSAFQMSGLALGALTIAVGVVMLIMSLQLVGIFPWADNFKFTLPKSLTRALGLENHQKEYNHRGAMILGGLTFFLPCGFTQAMQVYAVSTGSFTGGALVMSMFALGTLPGMLSIGGLTSVMKGKAARRFFKGAGLAVLFFALFNIHNGLTLGGWNNLAYGKTETVTDLNDPNVKLVDGVQVVTMKEVAEGYSPNKFTIAKGVPVKWVITAEEPYSCASTIMVPKYNITKHLTAGENVINFTPTSVGRITFSCSMGMYTGVFNVVDTETKANSAIETAQAATPAPVANVGGSTCGATAGGGGGCGCGGGGKQFVPDTVATEAKPAEPEVKTTAPKEQVIESSFTYRKDIEPNTFRVKAGVPVKYIVNPTEDGEGCMSTIMIQSLYPNPILIRANQQIVMNFTPEKPGKYLIVCAMNVPRGQIIVE